ncbi:hypothetical protein ACNKHU_12640 [Shigella flexneri]
MRTAITGANVNSAKGSLDGPSRGARFPRTTRCNPRRVSPANHRLPERRAEFVWAMSQL